MSPPYRGFPDNRAKRSPICHCEERNDVAISCTQSVVPAHGGDMFPPYGIIYDSEALVAVLGIVTIAAN